MERVLSVAVLGVCLVSGAGVAEAQDVTAYRLHMTGGGSMSISKGRAWFDSGPAGLTMGYEPEVGRFWMANTAQRTYWEGTAEEYCAAARQEKSNPSRRWRPRR